MTEDANARRAARPRRQSLAGRLMLWITVTITALWLVAVGFGALIMQDEFGEIYDSALQETAERLTPLLLDDLRSREDPTSPSVSRCCARPWRRNICPIRCAT